MSDLPTLFARVRARAERESGDLRPCVGEQDVARAESLLGFPLPPVLAGLYRHVADGGFGPEYFLLPLVGEEGTVVSTYRALRAEAGTWPHGMVPVLDWGCGMYAAVDCLREGAPVLLFEPNAVGDDWADAWFEDAPSLRGWLLSWLDGTGWWEEEVMAAGGVELTRWPGAGARLAARA
ncbi:SMI1/KNR4 family protein [Streptomyces avicenniae]|uniref:SMI1/KNR4 family protein n=1 Tax=Streptomyces avicenniae TaxID=500153 RepID=UPI00069C6007|nr:SMI1/KNR4 family protein [Streptomyces avicenniae]